MEELKERAARAGVATEYWDGVGELHRVAPDVLSRVLEALDASGGAPRRLLPGPIVVRDGSIPEAKLNGPEGLPVHWELYSGCKVAEGETSSPGLKLPDGLPRGLYRLTAIAGDEEGSREEVPLIVAPRQAWQGDPAAPRRMWALSVQLYALRSRRNWGHGDFSDLLELIDIAADLGAAGIGLNPLHALMDDKMEEPSPYYPNSRLFLNPLYIDVQAIPEFSGLTAAAEEDIRRLRSSAALDYPAVAALKTRALEAAYGAFLTRASPERRTAFAQFRSRQSQLLPQFACFEFLRRKLACPWWEWPQELRQGEGSALARVREFDETRLGFFEFVQWVAHEQLEHCRIRARMHGMPIGLYLDIAVGVRSDGFDAWCDQEAVLAGIAVGAPPDALNSLGQNWGLAGFNPVGLERQHFEPFRQLLHAAMRYAGAVRLDHVLGLQRLYIIPHGTAAKDGTYIRLPFQALLATAALESVQQQCVLIGEDLGTVPANFRETLMDWGVWSYQVMLFERTHGGGFAPPETYRENALVTFATHDLPTFAGWRASRDLVLKRALHINSGESDEERRRALEALDQALRARGIERNDFAAVARYLADTPSRLLVISLEDFLGVEQQVNLPGTTDEHPNWRQPLPASLEGLREDGRLAAVADVLRSAGRSCR